MRVARRDWAGDEVERVQPHRWEIAVVWGAFNIYAVIAVGTAIGYWVGVGQELDQDRGSPIFVTIHVHLIIAVIVITELSVTKLPIRLLHVYLPMTFSFFYVIVTILLHVFDVKSDVYSVLNWKENPGLGAGVSVILIFAACPVVHLLMFVIYKLRMIVHRQLSSEVIVIQESNAKVV